MSDSQPEEMDSQLSAADSPTISANEAPVGIQSTHSLGSTSYSQQSPSPQPLPAAETREQPEVLPHNEQPNSTSHSQQATPQKPLPTQPQGKHCQIPQSDLDVFKDLITKHPSKTEAKMDVALDDPTVDWSKATKEDSFSINIFVAMISLLAACVAAPFYLSILSMASAIVVGVTFVIVSIIPPGLLCAVN